MTSIAKRPVQPPTKLLSEIEKIKDEIYDFKTVADQLSPASARVEKLEDYKSRLESIPPNTLDDQQQCIRWHSLAMLCDSLGAYDEAERHYREAVPYMYIHTDKLDSNGLALFCARFKTKFRGHHMTVMLDYFNFTIESNRNLDGTEEILRALPWLANTVQGIFPTDTERQRILLLTIRVYNAQHNYAEAIRQFRTLEAVFELSKDYPSNGTIEMEKALILAGQSTSDSGHTTYCDFALALTMTCVNNGIWHRTSLNILYLFGKQLRVWGHLEAAQVILQECCLGTCYRFGWSHPISNRARSQLEQCDSMSAFSKSLARFRGLEHSEQASIAYEHMSLNTVVDLFCQVPSMAGIDWDHLEHALRHLHEKRIGRWVDVCRTLARCKEKRGDFQGAYALLGTEQLEVRKTIPIRMDMIRIIIQDKGIDDASSAAKSLLFDIGNNFQSDYKLTQLKAIRRKLTALGVMHFTPNQPSAGLTLVSEQSAEIMGTGTYAIVDSIQLGHELYARKSVALPRFRQQQIREAIRSEISVIRTLDHPHIIQICFTYEDKSRFYIIMDPLADCDLEAFLIQYGSKPPTRSQQIMVWKWFTCLSNTLAFIHSKGIRHKDIKPRNILGKGKDVIFADFGSSHVFLNGGDSTTEGPSYGHTKMYCAPEVIQQEKRNRSADIFSLGCVFTELAVWLVGWKDFQTHKWHEYRRGWTNDIADPPYHASLDLISQWFNTCGSHIILQLYTIVLRQMLYKAPEKRLKATDISKHLQELLSDESFPMAIKPCMGCHLDLWVTIDMISQPLAIVES
jgi:serine/threonine protein kinase/tetratricopeptide (TPR) repeat protein